MLSQVKTISYNKVTVHSYIFLYSDSGEENSVHGLPVQTSSVPAAYSARFEKGGSMTERLGLTARN